jgi:hypothetical protein
MGKFLGILGVILFFLAFILLHGSGWFIVAGLVLLAVSGWVCINENREDEEEIDPYL